MCTLLAIPIDDEDPGEENWIKGVAEENPFLTVDQKKPRRRSSSGKANEKKIKKGGDQDLIDFEDEKIDFEKPLPLDSERPILEYQRMLRNLEAHEIIMTIIKQNSIRGVQSEDLYYKVLKHGYSTLIRFVRNNKSNQKCLLGYVETVFKEHSASGLGATQLTGEILRDDPSLRQKGYSDFKDKVDDIQETDASSFQKSTQLHYLSVYMQFKEEPIMDNQIAVITELTQKDNDQTILLYNSDEERVFLSKIVDEITDKIDSQLSSNDTTTANVEIPAELAYSIELLNVMAVATRGKNAITEVMCQSLLPGQEFIKCYQEAKYLYNYKIALVEFFIDAYLDIEKDVPQSLQEDIWEFVSLLGVEFDLYMNMMTDSSIFSYYKDPSNANIGRNVGPRINLQCLFGNYHLRELLEDYI